jgi:hypothetical protein
MTDGFEVLVQLVMAAIRTLPCPIVAEPRPFHRDVGAATA